MSDTPPPVAAPAPTQPAPVSTTPATDSLRSPQAIVAIGMMAILAGTVAAVFAFGSPEVRGQTVGGVMTLGGMVVAFYFGSSRGSQAKDERQAAAAPEKPPVQQPGTGAAG